MPPLECKGTKTQRNLCQKPSIKRKNFIFHRKSWSIQKNDVPLHRNTGFSAVGSALRSGRRGRAFESPNPDKLRGNTLIISYLSLFRLQEVTESGQNRYRFLSNVARIGKMKRVKK